MSNLDIDPLEVLKEDLKDDSVEVQLEAVGALNIVALALGPARTASDLIETLEKYCFPVEIQAAKSPEAYSNTDALAAKEEVLAAIAERLTPDFIEYVGGSKTAAATILPLLEKLAMVEETVIRQAAVGSLCKMFDNLSPDHVKESGLGILQRLADADWFTSRVSASSLTATLYKILSSDEDRKTILETHKRLCQDDMPMVKTDAFQNLVPLLENIHISNLMISYAKPLLEQLQHELMESMRQTMVDIVKKLANQAEEEKSGDIVPQFVKAAIEDDSWRVRKHAAEELANICCHLNKHRVTEEIAPLYIKLLSDSEPQVRKSTINAMEKFIETTEGAPFATMLANGPLQTLAGDSVAEVREALAEQVSCLGEHMSREAAKEKLLPILKKLAGDESPHARLNLCSKLGAVSKMLGIELFESEILPLLKEVTIDQRWRVRNSIVHNIAQIGIQMNKEKFAKSRLKEILVQSLKDPASTVRDTAADQLKILNEKFGFDWMKKNLFDPMKTIYQESGNYLHRMVPLKAVQLMANDLTAAQLNEEFGPLLLQALEDPISNVRFTACRVLKDVIPKMDSAFIAKVKSKLSALTKEDTDDDVRYFADQALTVC